MRLAYADPPYPGQEARYEITSGVNHRLLFAYLDEFDGWALSTSAPALREVWNLAPHARCGSWVKTYASNGWSRVRYSWEPVLFVPPRRGLKPGETSKVWDSLVCAPVHNGIAFREVPGEKNGGEKPHTFVRWVMELLDFNEGDELVDVFEIREGISAAPAVAVQGETPDG